MRVTAVILAAGKGERFGTDKTQALLGRKPLWRWSYETFLNHPSVSSVGIIGSESNLAALQVGATQAAFVAKGGETRQESSKIATDLAADDTDILLIHDAARPFVSNAVIDRVIQAAQEYGAAAPGIPVTDTIKLKSGNEVTTLDRQNLAAMQTPQGAKKELLVRAHKEASCEGTDELSLLESIGIQPCIVEGDKKNFKVTTPMDLWQARMLLGGPETRTGLGYDVHSFSQDSSRKLMLGGVHFPDHPALDGHSDADVILHAAVDALLGAAALGDIGQHFPNDDPRWQGEPSSTFLKHAAVLLSQEGWQLRNLDIAVIAETPKIMKKSEEIRAHMAEALGVEIERVSVKATTNEKLGSIGRGEGIAAFATATIAEKVEF